MLRTCNWPKFRIQANGQTVAEFQADEWSEYLAWKALAIRKYGLARCTFSE